MGVQQRAGSLAAQYNRRMRTTFKEVVANQDGLCLLGDVFSALLLETYTVAPMFSALSMRHHYE